MLLECDRIILSEFDEQAAEFLGPSFNTSRELAATPVCETSSLRESPPLIRAVNEAAAVNTAAA